MDGIIVTAHRVAVVLVPPADRHATGVDYQPTPNRGHCGVLIACRKNRATPPAAPGEKDFKI